MTASKLLHTTQHEWLLCVNYCIQCGFDFSCIANNTRALACAAQLVGLSSCNRKVVDLISSQGTFRGCRLDPLSGRRHGGLPARCQSSVLVHTGGNHQYFCLPLPLSLPLSLSESNGKLPLGESKNNNKIKCTESNFSCHWTSQKVLHMYKDYY